MGQCLNITYRRSYGTFASFGESSKYLVLLVLDENSSILHTHKPLRTSLSLTYFCSLVAFSDKIMCGARPVVCPYPHALSVEHPAVLPAAAVAAADGGGGGGAAAAEEELLTFCL